jgi:hypothetical protein
MDSLLLISPRRFQPSLSFTQLAHLTLAVCFFKRIERTFILQKQKWQQLQSSIEFFFAPLRRAFLVSGQGTPPLVNDPGFGGSKMLNVVRNSSTMLESVPYA